jgi:serine/threonine-protein kinase ULK2
MAPEILNGQEYNYKVDLWSLGVSIFEALTGRTPFNGCDKEDLTRNVNAGVIHLPRALPMSNCCLDFIGKCLRFNPQERISIDHALNHPFINPDSP